MENNEELLVRKPFLTRPSITVLTSARLTTQLVVRQHGTSLEKSENIPNRKLSTGSEIVLESSNARFAAPREIAYADVPMGEEHSVLMRILSCNLISSL